MRITADTRASVGHGARFEVAGALAALGVGRVALLVDAAVANLEPTRALVDRLRTDGLDVMTVERDAAEHEPSYADLDALAAPLRETEATAVVGVGGGSTLDLAKGLAILLRNPGRGIDYRGVDLVERPGVPAFLLPTTAGSGSEATSTASFIDRESMTKLGINGRFVGCEASFLDPGFLAGAPHDVTVAPGLDALVHAVEAATARTATRFSRLLAVEATALMFSGLRGSVADPSDLAAREDALVGAHLAAIAMQNAAGGPASGISYPLGVHYGVPHGYAGGLLLSHVVQHNVGAGATDGYAELASGVTELDPGTTRLGAAQVFARLLTGLVDELAAPRSFARWGVGRAAVGRLTELTLAERAANLALNPVPFGEPEVVALLSRVVGD